MKGNRNMNTFFHKIVNGKLIEISYEQAKKLHAPALLDDEKSIKAVRKYLDEAIAIHETTASVEGAPADIDRISIILGRVRIDLTGIKEPEVE